jgi:hypothetical protein
MIVFDSMKVKALRSISACVFAWLFWGGLDVSVGLKTIALHQILRMAHTDEAQRKTYG